MWMFFLIQLDKSMPIHGICPGGFQNVAGQNGVISLMLSTHKVFFFQNVAGWNCVNSLILSTPKAVCPLSTEMLTTTDQCTLHIPRCVNGARVRLGLWAGGRTGGRASFISRESYEHSAHPPLPKKMHIVILALILLTPTGKPKSTI